MRANRSTVRGAMAFDATIEKKKIHWSKASMLQWVQHVVSPLLAKLDSRDSSELWGIRDGMSVDETSPFY